MADAAAIERRFALADLLDRVLATGVVVSGQVTLSVADVDLVYLNLQALLASVESVRDPARPPAPRVEGQQRPAHALPTGREPASEARESFDDVSATATRGLEALERFARRGFPLDDGPGRGSGVEGERVARALAKLVLVLVDQIRELMERQAIRRMEAGTLTPQETERLGDTFAALERGIEDMKARFGLEDEDLTLGLGPGSVYDLG